MTYKKPEQKLVSFSIGSPELDSVSKDILGGWSIINIVRNGNYYVAIMELRRGVISSEESVFIPPRKKIKILSK
ncbi:MAG: DUF2674 domain-containing protein [Rickettsiaceae bacterium]|nr:DUF2674 domain-containing protein [Rickettsiaceae bacterium]